MQPQLQVNQIDDFLKVPASMINSQNVHLLPSISDAYED